LIVPDLKNDPKGLEQFFELDPTMYVASELGGELEKINNRDIHKLKILSITENTVNLTGNIVTHNIITEQLVYNNTINYSVDKNSKIVQGTNALLKFPNDAKKQTYRMFHPIVESVGDFNFETIEQIDGIEVYVYSYEIDLDSTGSLPEFEGYPIINKQYGTSWVEPITGDEVDFVLYYNLFVLDGDESIEIMDGNTRFTEYTKIVNIQNIKDKRDLFFLYDNIIPMFMVIITAGVTLVIFTTQNLKTRTKELELSKKQKFETMGRLSSHLAHDMRNPLSIIQMTLDNVRFLYGNDKTKQGYFKKIDRSISRISHQIDNVLDFVKEKPLNVIKTKTSKILLDSIDLILIPTKISIILPEKDVEIWCDEEQLVIAVTNLVLNSIQAIKNEGTIKIRVNENNRHVIITVEDSGPGIPKNKLDEIFEPLYTTKQQGTGLGLASVKSIINAHSGTISVTTPPTIFTISLPKILKNGLKK